MKIAGEATLTAPVEQVWDALLDPTVLVATIPGCERLEQTGEHAYDMTVTAGVAAIRGTYAGTCRLHDLKPRESLVLSVQGAGAPGTIGAEVDVRFEDNHDGTTTLLYDADAIVGGMVGGVGQRMLTSVSRRMAAEFFTAVERQLTGTPVETAQNFSPGPVETAQNFSPGPVETAQNFSPGVYTAPPRAGGTDRDGFLKGVALGAGLVLLGVVAGGLFGRRRR
jgi:carbon monoxide dehydrogenase subunit G